MAILLCCDTQPPTNPADTQPGEGILAHVQLRGEAFEYLQLPLVIKEGSVGRLKLQVRVVGPGVLSTATCQAAHAGHTSLASTQYCINH